MYSPTSEWRVKDLNLRNSSRGFLSPLSLPLDYGGAGQILGYLGVNPAIVRVDSK
jgi:hypothetical protein